MSKRKASNDNSNKDFSDFLNELANYEKNISQNIHKYHAYKKAALVLASHPQRIKSGEEARKLKGIGKKIAEKIDEFIQTGKLRKLENIHNDSESQAINELTNVFGIGPKKAKQLFAEGIQSVEDLRKHPEKLVASQKIGLKYYEDFSKKIPREEISVIEKNLIDDIKNLDPGYTITICGSYRRGKKESGDIDVLITHPKYSDQETIKNNSLRNIINCLEKCGLITDTLSLGETKFMGVCKIKESNYARRIDIRLVPHDQYYCCVLYFTGSDVFNQRMRAHALENGFTLNEYSLRPVGSTGIPGEPVEINSEEDIFDYINFPYCKPHERNI